MAMHSSLSRCGKFVSEGAPRNGKCKLMIGQGDLGLGLFANRDIAAGEKILTFRGPIIDFDAAVAKGDKECYPLQVSPDRYIDLRQPGCYANHSCDPNAGIRIFTLVALTHICKGVEIRYDYSTTMDEDFFEMSCRCKSAICRGIVTDFRHLASAVRRRYLNLGLVQAFIASQYDSSSGLRNTSVSAATRRLSSRKQKPIFAAVAAA
jgi:uncharacterized protein